MPGGNGRSARRLCLGTRPLAEVFGGLTYLPITIGERCLVGGLDIRAVERRESNHGPPTHRGFVVCQCVEDRGQRSGVTNGPQCCHCGFPTEWILVRLHH